MKQEPKTLFYCRVSDAGQNEVRQLTAFKELGDYKIENCYIDKQSGKDFNREQYIIMKKSLQENDLLVIKSIDRLGRNYEMIIDEWKDITKNIKADIFVIDMPLLDTRQNKDLLGTFISDLILQILSYVAEQERAFIRLRQAEGIAAAKAGGKVKFGAPVKTRDSYDDTFYKYYAQWKNKQINLTELSKLTGVCRNTCYNRIKVIEES